MIKVFVNNKPIIFSDVVIKASAYRHYIYKDISVSELIHKLKHTRLKGVVLLGDDCQSMTEDFFSCFDQVSAAGGVVLNNRGEYLFIQRYKHWDLPKGKQEGGESIEQTALREVSEECGITSLTSTGFIQPTYHIYTEDGKEKLKTTYWYAMTYDGNEQPQPQIEEGITMVKFLGKEHIKAMCDKMYKNIEELITNHLNLE